MISKTLFFLTTLHTLASSELLREEDYGFLRHGIAKIIEKPEPQQQEEQPSTVFSSFDRMLGTNFTKPETCGNDICDYGENCNNCEEDCISGVSGGNECGNGICEDGEYCYTCPEDCNGDIEGETEEKFCCFGGPIAPMGVISAVKCDVDIRCGESRGLCTSKASPIVHYCCGDGICTGDETFKTCPTDNCATLCGNGVCDVDEGETVETCDIDCYCDLNGKCDPWETTSKCDLDCHCGNYRCQVTLGETVATCPHDCGCNANGHCDDYEDAEHCPYDKCLPKDTNDDYGDYVMCKNHGDECDIHDDCCSMTCAEKTCIG